MIRLVLNSKEVDLDISIASGIEHDVWCYIVDNPCLLSGVSTCNDCTTNCCGDNKLDFDNLMTQTISDSNARKTQHKVYSPTQI
jgi:hypothetical protein